MALAPGIRQRHGILGAGPARPQSWTPGIGEGRDDVAPMTSAQNALGPQKAGFDWGKLLGVVGDSLSILGGGEASYVPLMQQRNQLAHARAYAEQQYQRRRQDDYRDRLAFAQWERDNRKPTTVEQTLDAAGYTGDERTALLRRKAENDAAGVPVAIDVTNPDGSVSRQYVRPGSLGGGAAPARPVGKLTPYNGGPTPTASGGFL